MGSFRAIVLLLVKCVDDQLAFLKISDESKGLVISLGLLSFCGLETWSTKGVAWD